MLEKLLMWILTPMINREVNKIKNDPEIKAAQAAVEYAIDQYNISAKRAIEIRNQEAERRQKERDERRKSRMTKK